MRLKPRQPRKTLFDRLRPYTMREPARSETPREDQGRARAEMRKPVGPPP